MLAKGNKNYLKAKVTKHLEITQSKKLAKKNPKKVK